MDIYTFSGEHRWLSNFWPAQIRLENDIYPSVEHAYQAAKTLSPREREQIRTAITPGQAKRLGRHISMRPNWDSLKLHIMEELVYQKFSQEPLRSRLLATGTCHLQEGNTWNDTYWGVCNGRGLNHLGMILMRVRNQLNAEISGG